MTITPGTTFLADVRIHADDLGIHVSPVWAVVDRPISGGWTFPHSPAGRKLADRLKRAIEAGVVYDPATISVRTDVNGQTYVQATSRVSGRCANADLKRVGF